MVEFLLSLFVSNTVTHIIPEVNVFVFQCGRYSYRSVFGALRSVCQTEGPAALFSGLVATLLRDVPFSGIYVMFYSQTKASLPKGKTQRDGVNSDGSSFACF